MPTLKSVSARSASAPTRSDPLRAHAGSFVVLKFGGHAIERASLGGFAKEVAALSAAGALPVVVHGAGPQIDEMMKRLGLAPKFANGLRVTDAQTLEVVEMVLASVGKSIVSELQRRGLAAISLSGRDANLLAVERRSSPDLGFVGKVVAVDTVPLALLCENGFVPVLAPIGTDGTHAYNVNADEVAGAVAAALSASALLLLSNVDGVQVSGSVAPRLTTREIAPLISSGEASSGMIPKLSAAATAASAGVGLVRICLAEPLERLLSPGERAGTIVTAEGS